MNLYDAINQILQDNIPFDKENIDEYYQTIDTIRDKILDLLPQKTVVDPNNPPRPNTPLWLWLKGSKDPILAHFRTNYHEPLFWEIVDGDYINNSNAIKLDRTTHYMYLNKPE